MKKFAFIVTITTLLVVIDNTSIAQVNIDRLKNKSWQSQDTARVNGFPLLFTFSDETYTLKEFAFTGPTEVIQKCAPAAEGKFYESSGYLAFSPNPAIRSCVSVINKTEYLPITWINKNSFTLSMRGNKIITFALLNSSDDLFSKSFRLSQMNEEKANKVKEDLKSLIGKTWKNVEYFNMDDSYADLIFSFQENGILSYTYIHESRNSSPDRIDSKHTGTYKIVDDYIVLNYSLRFDGPGGKKRETTNECRIEWLDSGCFLLKVIDLRDRSKYYEPSKEFCLIGRISQ
jgi:hypothetical protein